MQSVASTSLLHVTNRPNGRQVRLPFCTDILTVSRHPISCVRWACPEHEFDRVQMHMNSLGCPQKQRTVRLARSVLPRMKLRRSAQPTHGRKFSNILRRNHKAVRLSLQRREEEVLFSCCSGWADPVGFVRRRIDRATCIGLDNLHRPTQFLGGS